MTIAEKIARAKTDLDDAYAVGYAKGQAEGGDTTAAYNEGFEAGKQAESEAFWDDYQENGTRRDYWGGFAGWKDEMFKPKYPFDNLSDVGYMFYKSHITTAPRICLGGQSVANFINGAKSMRWIEGLVFLKEILTASNFASTAEQLEHCPIESGVIGVSLNASSCPFDKETIISFINALSVTKTGLTLTLSKNAVNTAFETSEGAADGSTSAEWSALIATKKNWTISLV